MAAVKKKNIALIEQALQEIEDRDYVHYLQPEVQQADHVLFVLVKAEERAKKAVPTLDASTLSEVRAYKHPPTHVHRIVQAVLLLLGEHEQRTEVDWTKGALL
jgi:selenocysteine lyase/cysteine desulfurase